MFSYKNSMPLVVTIIFLSIPLYLIQNDLWDGVIISYGSAKNDLSGIKFWFFQSGWHLQYFQIALFHALAKFLSIDYVDVNKLIICISFFFILKEISFMLKKVFQIKKIWIFLVFLFFSASPFMSVLSSSVMGFHLVSLLFCMMGVRLFRKNYYFLGALLMLLSFSYPATLGLAFGISYFLDSVKKNKKFLSRNLNIYFPSAHSIIVILLASTFYISHKILFVPYGFWEEYYSIRNIFSLKGFFVFGFRTIEFISHFLPMIIIGTLICIINKKFSFKKIFYCDEKIIGLIFLTFSSCITYILVGKSAGIIDIYDWSTRHVMPFYIPFAIISILFIKKFVSKNILKNLLIFFPFILNISFGIYSWNDKLQRDDFYKIFGGYLSSNIETFQNSRIYIIRDNKPAIRFYEYNYIYFLNTKKDNSFIAETSFKLDAALNKVLNADFGLKNEDLVLLSKMDYIDKLRFLESSYPDLKKSLELYLVSDIDSISSAKSIDENVLKKDYGKELGIGFKRYLRSIADNLFDD